MDLSFIPASENLNLHVTNENEYHNLNPQLFI